MDGVPQEKLSQAMRLAFIRLASIELGEPIHWRGPEEFDELRSRVETLSVLKGIIPRQGIGKLDEIVVKWMADFPDVSALAVDLKASAFELLTAAENESVDYSAFEKRIEALLDVHIKPSAFQRQPVSEKAMRDCAQVLWEWRSSVSQSAEWNRVAGLTPGDPDVPLGEVYVELYGFQDSDLTEDLGFAKWTPSQISSLGIVEAIERSLECCVVVGEPGAGKSTVVKWLVWAVQNSTVPGFDIALAINLKSLAECVRRKSVESAIGYFVTYVLPSIENAEEVGECLRRASAPSKRVMLLLDGWDEVPYPERDRVKALINRERHSFFCVLTSRRSGLPSQVFESKLVDFYSICGLGEDSIREFVWRRMAAIGESNTTATEIVNVILENPELRSFAANPFLLGIMVRVLLLPGFADRSEFSRASFYREITNWIREQARQIESVDNKLDGTKFEGLYELARRLMLDETSPRFVFGSDELEQAVGQTEALISSRFLNRTSAAHNNWSFLHATLQEFIGAHGVANQSPHEMDAMWDKMFLSSSRLVTLEFYCGLTEASSEFSANKCKQWQDRQDRFGILAGRLLRLAASAGWKKLRPELYSSIITVIWKMVEADRDWKFVRQLLLTVALVDDESVLAVESKKIRQDTRFQQLICETLPPSRIMESSMFNDLHANLKEHLRVRRSASLRVDYAQTNEVREAAWDSLSNDELTSRIRQTPSQQFALELFDRIKRSTNGEERQSLILALAPYFQLLPTTIFVELVIEPIDGSPELTKQAVAMLGISRGCGQRMNPTIRDKLICRLAVLNFGDDRVEAMLDSVISYPIRDGGQFIAEIAANQSANSSVRISACAVLRTVSDVSVIERVVNTIETEPSPGLVETLMDVAIERQIDVPMEWLQVQIRELLSQERSRLSTAIDLGELWSAYLRYAYSRSPNIRLQCISFMDPIFRLVLNSDDSRTDFRDFAFELATSVRAARRKRAFLRSDDDLFGVARDVIETGLRNDELNIGKMSLALELVSHNATGSSIVRQLLEKLIPEIRRKKNHSSLSNLEALAVSAIESLSETSLGSVVRLLDDSGLVRDVLARLAVERDLVVLDSEVFDRNGNQIVFSTPVEGHAVEYSKDFDEAFKRLTVQQRKALQSYLFLTKHSDECNDESTLAEIHHCLLNSSSGEIRDLRKQCYGDRPPSFNAWKRSLYRAKDVLASYKSGTEYVREIGLQRYGK